jgi:hypothetical protein
MSTREMIQPGIGVALSCLSGGLVPFDRDPMHSAIPEPYVGTLNNRCEFFLTSSICLQGFHPSRRGNSSPSCTHTNDASPGTNVT